MARYRIYNRSTGEYIALTTSEESVVSTAKLEMNQITDAVYIANALNVYAFPEINTWKVEEVQD